jgi:uncharacterized RDD family membrane protein YckC
MTDSRAKSIKETAAFDAVALKAPFPLRIAAAAVDYMVVFMVPLSALAISDLLSDRAHPPSIGAWGWLLALIVFIVNCIALPLLFGRTLGKWLFGLTIVTDDGGSLSLGRIIIRNVFGYFLIPATLGIGFLVAAFSTKGRSLHDLIAKTVVIRGSKRIKS